MKKVLIVGKGSYIGASFEQYAQGRLNITTVDSRNDAWKAMDYSGFDSVVFVAGIAHRKQTKDNKDLYFAVNRDLAIAVAVKSKSEGVGQFVYLSSMAIYGIKNGEIKTNTVPAPPESDYYSLSKYQAEKLLEPMTDDRFKITLVRPPMVYGYGCRGKFQGLVKAAKLFPFLPTLENRRSMIFIENLCEFLAVVVERGISGAFCPQNKDFVKTTEMLERVARTLGKKPRRMPLMNLFIRAALPFSPALNSAFGSFYCSDDVSKMPFEKDYRLVGFEESIRKSVAP